MDNFESLLPDLTKEPVFTRLCSSNGIGKPFRTIDLKTVITANRTYNRFIVTIGENTWEYSTLVAAVRQYTKV